MILRAVTAVLCLLLNFPAFAYDAKTLKAMDGVESELSYCIGYFSIVKQCIGNQDAKLSESTAQVIRVVGERAVKLGLDIGMSNEAIVTRSSACKEVLLHQDAVLQEYLNR